MNKKQFYLCATGLYLTSLGAIAGDGGWFDKRKDNDHAVQDFKRERTFSFAGAGDSIPAYIKIRHVNNAKHLDYTVEGATHVSGEEGTATHWYGTQLPADTDHTVTITGKLKKEGSSSSGESSYSWPGIHVYKPQPLFINRLQNRIPPAEKETIGSFIIPVNNNDSDGDSIIDHADIQIVGGDPDLVALEIRSPNRMPVTLTVSPPGIVALYETANKRYGDHLIARSSAVIGATQTSKTYSGFDDGVVFVEGLTNGFVTITLEGLGGLSDSLGVTVLSPSLVPDYTRDHKIDQADRRQVTLSNPYRYWFNDDYDKEGEGASNEYDQPGLPTPDGNDLVVNTLRDLIDFHSVWVDLKDTLTVLGRENYRYYLAYGEPTDINDPIPDADTPLPHFLFTTLGVDKAGDYLTTIATAEYVAAQTLVSPIYVEPDPGVELPETFLDEIEAGRGIVLLEHGHMFGSSDAHETILHLRVVNLADEIILEHDLPFRISSVEKMFTHKDLRGEVATAIVGNGGEAEPDWNGNVSTDRFTGIGSEPTNYPNSLTNGKAFVFVHGYNNNLQASRGGNAEMFKRLFWQGSRAKYYAVSWYGYQSQIDLNWLYLGWKCPNYQANVINAFKTSSAFGSYVSGLPESTKIVAAHSLGNMMVSSAIQDYALAVDKYFLLNAAVSAESYSLLDEEGVLKNMVHRDWGVGEWWGEDLFNDPVTRDQYSGLFAYNWYKLFNPDILPGSAGYDSRSTLTWNGRFAKVPIETDVYNFWSAGDRTLADYHLHGNSPGGWTDWDTPINGEKGWYLQEKRKGRAGLIAAGGSYIGGWGVNEYYTSGGEGFGYLGQLETIPDSLLKTEPLFLKGDDTTIPNFQDLFDPVKTDSASVFNTRAALLATFVPATRYSMGGTINVTGFSSDPVDQRQFEMQFKFNNGGWHDGTNVNGSEPKYWNHGDFKTVAMPYVYELYQKFVTIGELDEIDEN